MIPAKALSELQSERPSNTNGLAIPPGLRRGTLIVAALLGEKGISVSTKSRALYGMRDFEDRQQDRALASLQRNVIRKRAARSVRPH